jgi:hypothetical protein
MRRAVLAALMSGFFVSCASAPQPDPTPDRPRVGCRVDALGGAAMHVDGKLLPAVVRVIGTYEHDESHGRFCFPRTGRNEMGTSREVGNPLRWLRR